MTTSNSTKQVYWVCRKDRITGPLALGQVRQMISAGMLAEDDRISVDQVHFEVASNFPELLSSPDSSLPQPPPVSSAPDPQAPTSPAAASEQPKYKLPLPVRALIWLGTFVGGMLGAEAAHSLFEVRHEAALAFAIVPFLLVFLYWTPTSMRK